MPLINQKIEQKRLERTIKQEQGKIQTFEDKLQQLQLLELNLEQLFGTQKRQQQQWQRINYSKASTLLKQRTDIATDNDQFSTCSVSIRGYQTV